MAKKSKYSAEARTYVGRKIRHLVEREGKTRAQAVGQAMGMARSKGLRVPPPKPKNRFTQRATR